MNAPATTQVSATQVAAEVADTSPVTETLEWPEFRFLPVNLLTMDERYQRELNRNRIEQMVEHFDTDLFGALHVASRPDGTFSVIDGQHRAVAASLKGLLQVPAFVTNLTSPEAEATTFVQINNTRAKTTPYQTWRAASFADENSLQSQADRILAKYGKRVGANGNENVIKAVGTLNWILDRGGLALFHDTIDVIANSWDGVENAWTDKIIKGTAYFLWVYDGKINREKLITALRNELATVGRGYNPTKILVNASNAKSQNVMIREIGNMLLNAYNRQHKTKHMYRNTRPNKNEDYVGFPR